MSQSNSVSINTQILETKIFEKKIKKVQIAKALNITKCAVSQMLKRKRTKFTAALVICELLNCKFSDIFKSIE